jgi:Ca2+-binding RTX toxin-like protein
MGDINGDGLNDAVFVATNGTRDATWFLGQATPASGAWTPFAYKGTLGGGSQDAELADINDDGCADLTRLVSTGTDGTITRSVRWGATSGTFSASSTTVLSKSLQGTAGADTLTGIANQVNFLFGDGGNDTLNGSLWFDRLDGGAGDDSLSGGAGSDIYAFGVGSGVDRITDTGGRADILAFSTGVSLSDVILDLDAGGDLRLGIATTSNRTVDAAADRVTLSGYIAATDKPIEKLSFADGSQIDLQRLVQAMGAFKSATTGEVDLKQPNALKVATQLLVHPAFRTVA